MIQRLPKKEFKLQDRPRLVKNSATYNMCVYGPIIQGDHLYLVHDGKLTKYAKWLMLAADMGLTFLELCILARILKLKEIFGDEFEYSTLFNKLDIVGEFIYVSNYRTILNSFSILHKKEFIRPGNKQFTIVLLPKTLQLLQSSFMVHLDDIIQWMDLDMDKR